jgi:hypothetical protein
VARFSLSSEMRLLLEKNAAIPHITIPFERHERSSSTDSFVLAPRSVGPHLTTKRFCGQTFSSQPEKLTKE